MAQDRWDALEAKLARIRQETERGFGARADELAAEFARWEGGDEAAGAEVRRCAHKLRGVATDPLLRDAAGLLEQKCDAGVGPDELGALTGRVVEMARAISAAAGAPEEDASAPAEPVVPPANAEGAAPAAVARVLVVDDDDAIRRMHATTLARLGGFEVVDLGQPTEAVALATEFRPSLILVDAMMPGLNGDELCAALRAALGHEVKLVIVSAATPTELGWTQGLYDAWWRKPLAARELVERARTLLGIALA